MASKFQSTFPQGERLSVTEYHKNSIIISIHVPARGTTAVYLLHRSLPLFQSTFPQGERPMYGIIKIKQNRISIHVPARGTTANISNIITQNNHTFISSIHSFEYHTAESSPLPPKPSVFCAIFPVRIPRTFHVCFTFALQKQCLICRNPLINPHMLYFCFILISQIIESQAVDLFINNFSQ